MEAAQAGWSLGASVALVSMSTDTIAQMSCNPAIGGVGKGQIVREIDALGGFMGQAADATGIQFRMLNRSKGPAVWGPRCQSDRHAYAAFVQAHLASRPGLAIIQAQATRIIHHAGKIRGVEIVTGTHPSDGSPDNTPSRLEELTCRAVIITAGTFLNGMLFMGQRSWVGGRIGEQSARHLSSSLAEAGLQIGRMRTDTCPRLLAESIDHSRCVRQDGDAEPAPFSFMTDKLTCRQVPCWITATTPDIHRLIRDNLDLSPIYDSRVRSVGPRYCPSIETKIVRFADKPSHQVFLEPEGKETKWVYCNGITTSLPEEIQDKMIHLIPGLERAQIVRMGYGVEYDFFPPTQLHATLETKCLPGLYLAGQVNGTTGYEEAAAQGLVAGANAALSLMGRPAMVLRRDQAYIGVMIDDLVTKGVVEPYRMFTSRAEYRLHLRADNADRRLTELGRLTSLVDDNRWNRFQQKTQTVELIKNLLRGIRYEGKSLDDWLRSPEITADWLMGLKQTAELTDLARRHSQAFETALFDARYAGYLQKQENAQRHLQDLEGKLIPQTLDYDHISQLRYEARQRLTDIKPRSLGQAIRISGITPADITVLAVHLAGKSHRSRTDGSTS